MITFEEVNKHYGQFHVLKDINLHIQKGEVVVIIGPSGSGKSTMLRCINRLESIDEGKVLVNEVPVQHPKTNINLVRQNIGIQKNALEIVKIQKEAARSTELAVQKFNAEVDHWIAWRDVKGRRAFTIPVSACSDDAEVTALDRVSMSEWMDARGLTSPRLRWWIDYACRDDYGMTFEHTSAWAGLFYFCSRVAAPKTESQSLITWPEGNGRLVQHLFEKSKANIQLDRAAVELIPTNDGVDVVTLDPQGREPRGFHARRVIFAAPQFMARYVMRPYRDNPPPHIAELQFGAWMVANLTLRDRPKPASPRDFPLAWDNVLYESPSLGYVVATHQRGLDRGPTVLTYYYPLCDENPRVARTRLLETDWRGWAEVTLSDLSRAHADIRGLVERLDVMRWGHAMIRPRTGFMWGSARREASKPFRSIHWAHSELSGVALFEEAFDNGLRVADEILSERVPDFL